MVYHRLEFRRHGSLSTQFLQSSVIVITLLLQVLPISLAQPGFVSIDCGSSEARYTDKRGLEWVTDTESYMTIGNTSEQSVADSSIEDYQYLRTFRYFPEHRNKYCYDLTPPQGNFLVRTSFYLNKNLLQDRQPFQFTLYINANNWFTLTSKNDSLSDLYVTQEAIVPIQLIQLLSICIQPVIGVPFISSLELRTIYSNVYAYNGSISEYLALVFRYNIGANSTSPAVRFPDDDYDRIWETPDASWAGLYPIASLPVAPDNTTRAEANNVPPKVMRDSWVFHSAQNGELSEMFFYLYPFGAQVQNPTMQSLYTALYAENLISNQTAYNMGIQLGDTFGSGDSTTIPVSNESTMGAMPDFCSQLGSLQVAALQLGNGTVGSIIGTLNGIETYAQYIFNRSYTSPGDYAAIAVLQQNFSLTDWNGDPCLPVAYDWLSCVQADYGTASCGPGAFPSACGQIGSDTMYYVKEINLSKLPPGNFSNFVSTAATNKTPTGLLYLEMMSITSSGVDSQNFEYLVQAFSSSLDFGLGITTLDLSDNAIDTIPLAASWSIYNLASLNLSHNKLTGVLNLFENMPFSSSLQYLNLSYNAMNSLPTSWAMEYLVVLDLSHNQFSNEISALDKLGQISAMSLKELYVSHNSFSGTLSSSLYFSDLRNLTIGIFDGNSIQGTLDLTAWYQKLQGVSKQYPNVTSGYLSQHVANLQLFSFINNSIQDIVPDAAALESITPLLQIMQNNGQGLLLGGNPYCIGAKSFTQRYICRFDINEVIQDKTEDDTHVILIASVISGVIVFVICSAFFLIILRLWRQLHSLRQIQKALMEQKVQPPFYHYSDLKLATRDFHKDNKLGQGGFGEVYKGVQPDGTMLAVKKLFNSQKENVLTEFLNEVVLIASIKHRNLVHLRGCCINNKERMLVYEIVEKGNLSEALWGSKAHGDLNWEQRFNICIEVARGISYLHEELQPSIIHRDIKPENILLDNNFKPKIADFGLARTISNESDETLYTRVAGTIGYFSPEYATQGQLSDKLDVYSYGIVVMEIVSGRKCIDHSRPIETRFLNDLVHRMHEKGTLMDVLQTELRDNCVVDQVLQALQVALLCVQQDPKRRPSMSQVVTMLSESVQLEVFEDSPREVQSREYFKDLLANIKEKTERISFESADIEDSSDDPLLYVKTPSSSSFSDKHGLKSLVEMISFRRNRTL